MLLVKEIAELQASSETGTVNDRTYKWLGDQGYTGTINDRIYAFLGDKGYEGTIINPYDGMSALYAEGAKYDLIEV